MTNATLERPDPDPVEADTILQPSLHTFREYLDLLLSEAVTRGIDVVSLQDDASSLDDDSDEQWVHEITDDVLDAIRDAGYVIIEENDSLLIYGLGVEVPE